MKVLNCTHARSPPRLQLFRQNPDAKIVGKCFAFGMAVDMFFALRGKGGLIENVT